MKSLLVALMVLSSSAAFAGDLVCGAKINGKDIDLELADWSNTIEITTAGHKYNYVLTPESSKTSRYKLPYIVFSKSYQSLQFAVFKTGEGNDLNAHITFDYLNPSSATYTLRCVYEASEH